MLRKSFRAVRVARADQPRGLDGVPLILIANHPSWWDPLLSVTLGSTVFPGRRHYAPIDASALEKYGFFRWLGFFGVEQGSPRGAATFLRTGMRILSHPDSALWITPQGEFADVRQRPVELKPGLGYLAKRAPQAATIPLALEYAFGEEKLPEVWGRFGRVIGPGSESHDAAGLTTQFAAALQSTQDQLARDVIARRREDYDTLLSSRSGVGGVYDVWRRAKAWSRGAAFNPEHGSGEPR